MNQKEKTRAEFTRQAERIEKSPEFTDAKVLRLIASTAFAGPGRKILDVGCGPGILSEAMAMLGAEVTGMDLTAEMIKRAKARCTGMAGVTFIEGDAENLPFEDGAFDSAAARLTIHHFTKPKTVLREIRRILKPGGRLTVVDITSPADTREAQLHNALETLRDPSHVRAYSELDLSALISETGFSIVDMVKWTRERLFKEWVDLTGAPERAGPLEIVMRALAENGIGAGMGLRLENGEIAFRHQWVMITAVKNG